MDNKSNNDETWIPEGFVEVLGPTGEKYLVPEFYAPALRNTLDAAKMKSNLGIENYNGTIRGSTSPFGVIGEGLIMSPLDQECSERERMSAHADVLSLQNRLGISYKDASHRLYMAEIEKLKSDQKTIKAFRNLQVTSKAALEGAFKAIKNLEEVDSETLESN